MSRRTFVGTALAGSAIVLGGTARARGRSPQTAQAVRVTNHLEILPRSTWGADLAPKGPMVPEDVRFLLVHHTATSNRIPDQRQLIRNIFAFHTSNAKRWNDVAYNYVVGPDGTVWEGRAGSLDGPVAPTPPAATRVSANWCACSATSRRPRRRRQCNTVSSCCSHTSRSATT